MLLLGNVFDRGVDGRANSLPSNADRGLSQNSSVADHVRASHVGGLIGEAATPPHGLVLRLASLPNGISRQSCTRMASISSAGTLFHIRPVSVAPGTTAFTRMPNLRSRSPCSEPAKRWLLWLRYRRRTRPRPGPQTLWVKKYRQSSRKLCCQHLLQAMFACQKNSGQVGIEDKLPAFEWHFMDQPTHIDPRIGEDAIGCAELFMDQHEGLHHLALHR